MSQATEILQSLDRQVLTIALNRPERHNALTAGMIAELTLIFQEIAERRDVRVVILTGNGRSFCAGADLNEMLAAGNVSEAENRQRAEALFDLLQLMDHCPRPVVARINGTAIGGGVGMLSCCDIVVAVQRASFSFSEVKIGIVPAMISPFVLNKIGFQNGRELFLTGERFKAARAKELGLVQYVVAEDALDQAVEQLVEALLQGAPSAQAAIKALLPYVAAHSRADVRSYTTRLLAEQRASDEGLEGMRAFLDKRPPSWQQVQETNEDE